MRRSLVVAGAALAAAAVPSVRLQAQGSAVQTHSSCATARAAAAVAAPCDDGSAVLFNPGALAMQGSMLSIGTTAITSSGSFTYDYTGERVTRSSETSQVPFGYASFKLSDRFAAAIGAFAPYGLRVSWPESFEGRFVSYDTQLKNIYIQPTIAARLSETLTLGVGLDYVRASINLNQRADLATTAVPAAMAPFPGATFGNFGVPLGTDFADARLSGEGTGVTFNVGGTVRVTPTVDLGVRYLHRVEIDYTGDVAFTQIATNATLPNGVPVDQALAAQFAAGGPLSAQGVKTSLTLPSQFVAGLAYRPLDAVKLLFDYQRTGWARFDSATIDFQGTAPDAKLILDYQSTNTFRFGADWATTPKLNLRAGFIFNTAAEEAASVSPLLPEAERNYYSAGLGYQLGRGLALDVGYQFVDQADRRGRTRGRTSIGQTPQQLNNGVYRANAQVLNATISYRFGGR